VSGRPPIRYAAALLACAALLAGVWVWAAMRRPGPPGQCGRAGRPPRLSPDYAGAVIPPNIAPLNFRVAEAGVAYFVRLRSASGEGVSVASRSPSITIPAKAWRDLLRRNRGAELRLEVYARAADGHWDQFDTVRSTVAEDEVDSHVVYRLIHSVYNLYVTMGIYQRDLESYDESLVLDNASFDDGCMNCHTFAANRPDRMAIQVRRGRVDYGNAMVVADQAGVRKVDTRTAVSPAPPAYMAWHPSGRLAAFSMNKVRQFFHTSRQEPRDVLDLESDLALYLADSGEVVSTPDIARPERLETYPAWSADGSYLYFSSAPILWSDREKVPPDRFNEVRYDLMRIRCDVEAHTWGPLETVLSAQETGRSITLPRLSPDGRFLLFCMSAYGCFPIHHADADLYMMDLRTGGYRRLEANSEQADTWHSWSSNGRWFVFSSKRPDGLLARLYLAHVDEAGNVGRPFLMPQEDPSFYDTFLKTYNVPELVTGPVRVRGEDIAGAIRSDKWAKAELPVTAATPRAEGGPAPYSDGGPWQPRR